MLPPTPTQYYLVLIRLPLLRLLQFLGDLKYYCNAPDRSGPFFYCNSKTIKIMKVKDIDVL